MFYDIKLTGLNSLQNLLTQTRKHKSETSQLLTMFLTPMHKYSMKFYASLNSPSLPSPSGGE
jgi:hypothetical protein